MQLSSAVQPETVFLTDADMARYSLNTSGSGNLLVLKRRQWQKCRDLVGGERVNASATRLIRSRGLNSLNLHEVKAV